MISICESFCITHRCQQEYPNESGAGNPHSSSDAANLLSFFTSLRSSLGSSKIISAAVTCLPWVGSNGSPLTNVASYAAQLTYANIMNYDTWVGLTESLLQLCQGSHFLLSRSGCFRDSGS